ncbi:MAG: FAD-dependent oxidoreductase [Nitrospiraceae bacterium]|nr:FAD-dependent oxidoreductase [Nitrospiraceae bacterium]
MSKFDFDVIVIGGGAGIPAALTAHGMGKKTALVEKKKIGGECTWTGCVPSKALIRAAHVAHMIKKADKFGLKFPNEAGMDASGVMEHVRSIVQNIYNTERPEIFEEEGIKVFIGSPRFLDNHHLSIDGKEISSGKFLICTGSSPFIQPIEGRAQRP